MRQLTYQIFTLLLLSVGCYQLASAQCTTTINTFPYTEDFEGPNGQNGWASGGGAISWAFGLPNKTVIQGASSGSNCWVTGGLGTTKYNPNENSFVTSPCFDFTSLNKPVIKLRVWWHSEFSMDGTVLQYSTNGGTIWATVGVMGDPYKWYNDNTINANPGGQGHGWTGINSTSSGGWVTAQHSLTNLAGQPSVRFRILFAAGGSIQYDGFAFDDVAIANEFQMTPVPDFGICGAGQSATLNAGPGYSCYSWSTGALSQLTNVNSATTYYIWVCDSLGFMDKDTVNVVYSPTFANLGPDLAACPYSLPTLNAGNPWADFLWCSGETTQTIVPTVSGTYCVTVSDSLGCVSSDSVFVEIDYFTPVDLGNDTIICFGGSILLDAGAAMPGTLYNWNFGAQTQAVYVSAPNNYSVLVQTPHGCTSTDTVNVQVVLAPIVNLGPDHPECGAFTLDAGNPGNYYLWSTGQQTQTISSTSPGTYWVMVSNQYGCIAKDTIKILPATPFSVSLGQDKVICDGVPVTLTSGNFGSGFTYFWSTNATTPSITVSAPGIYVLNVTNPQGCIRTDTVSVVLSSLSVDLGPDQFLCNGASTVLVAGSPTNLYSWNTGDLTPTLFVSQTGTFWVTVGDGTGCIIRDTINVTSAGSFSAGISAPTSGILTVPVNFTDNCTPAATSWHWDFGDSQGTSSLQSPSHAYQSMGIFTVTLVASNGGCTDTTTHEINIVVVGSIESADLGIHFKSYPNPNAGDFVVDINLDNPAPLSMELLDMTGRVVYHRDFGHIYTHNEAISVPDLSSGIYLIKLEKEGKSVFGKMVIEK